MFVCQAWRNCSKNRMISSRLLCLVLLSAAACRALEGIETVLPNGTRVVVEAEDVTVDISDAASRALPEDEGELKNLLNWAISKSLAVHFDVGTACSTQPSPPTNHLNIKHAYLFNKRPLPAKTLPAAPLQGAWHQNLSDKPPCNACTT